MGKHEQKRAEKRDRLMRAAVDAFTETGYDNTTVSDIVRRAGMTPSTFYNYFSDKEALLVEFLDQLADDLLSGLAKVRETARGPEEFTEQCCRAALAGMAGNRTLASLLKRNLPLARSLVDHDSLRPVYDVLKDELDKMVEQGQLARLDTVYAATAVRATILETGIAMLARRSPDVDEAVAFVASMLKSGFGGQGEA